MGEGGGERSGGGGGDEGGSWLCTRVVVLHSGGQQPCHVLLSFEAQQFPIKITATISVALSNTLASE